MRLRLFIPSVPITLHAGDEDVESTSDFNELDRVRQTLKIPSISMVKFPYRYRYQVPGTRGDYPIKRGSLD